MFMHIFSLKQVRNASSISSDTFPDDDRIKIVEGDVSDVESLKVAFAGASHALFTAAGASPETFVSVDENGPRNAMEAGIAMGLERVSICSSYLVYVGYACFNFSVL